ncbi:nitrite reductase small subunit NirD [Candidatus Woesearchaeota archaeon]|nr:nitrite reductase small subunit NirD [Candidatus Woesearchaeota archaeon]
MGKFVVVASVNEVKEGTGKLVEADGKEIALFNVKGSFFALSNTCAHMGSPLGEGKLDNNTVTCPWHHWQYDVKTGLCKNVPSAKVDAYKTKVENGKILVEV